MYLIVREEILLKKETEGTWHSREKVGRLEYICVKQSNFWGKLSVKALGVCKKLQAVMLDTS